MKFLKILSITFIILVLLAAATAVYVYTNRSSIINQSADKIIAGLMPDYIKIDDINIDLAGQKIVVKNFRIINPPGYTNKYLIEIPLVECAFKQRDPASILKGLRVGDIDLKEPVLYIERRKDQKLNVQQMDGVIADAAVNEDAGAQAVSQEPEKPGFFKKFIAPRIEAANPVKNIEDFLEIVPVFNIKSGTLIFDDYLPMPNLYRTTIQDIEAAMQLTLKKGFKGVDYIKSQGRGLVNGGAGEIVEWDSGYDPRTEKLTMYNKFKVYDVNFMPLKPYYEKFSPFIFESGKVSGDLVFDFDNGNIGSTNEVRLKDLKMTPRQDRSFQGFWSQSAEDLYTYFSSESGEIVFDFKIKGPMESPKIQPGPKTKRAMLAMTAGKIVDLFSKDKEQDGQAQAQGAGQPGQGQQVQKDPDEEKSDVEKVIDIFKSFSKKGSEEPAQPGQGQ